jgi:peptide/nickel transport system substrate-binding protein
MNRLSKLLVVTWLLGLLLTIVPSLVQADLVSDESPRYGGTLRIGVKSDPLSFNGLINFWGASSYPHAQVFNKLMSFNENMEFVPDLAESYEVSEDGTVWTFHLPKDVYWHDGEKLTSADVKWQYETAKDGVSLGAPFMQDIQSITTPDDYTVVIKFNNFNLGMIFGGISVSQDQRIMPKHIYEGTDLENNPANWAPIGSGPFIVTEYERDKYIIMKANENYHKGRPFLDELIWYFYPTQEAAILALKAGEIDYVHHGIGIPFSEIPNMEKNPNFEVLASPFVHDLNHRIVFNFREEAREKNPWLANKEVRRAIAMSIDRETITRELYFGASKPVYSAISEYNMPIWHNPGVDYPKYNPDEAENILDNEGYERGADGWRFECIFITHTGLADDAEIIKDYLRAVGINVELQIVETTAYLQLYTSSETGMGDFPITLVTFESGPDPIQVARWSSGAMTGLQGMNMGFYDNSRVTELLEIGQSTTDFETRKEAYYEIQEIMADEVPYVFLWGRAAASAWNPEFKGLEKLKPGMLWHIPLRHVWWTGGSVKIIEKETETIEVPVTPSWVTPSIAGLGIITVIAVAALILERQRK